MNRVDIRFPEVDYDSLSQIEEFTLIFPLHHGLAQVLQVDSMIRMESLSEDDMEELISSESEISKEELASKVKKARLVEIEYVRDTTLKNVSNREWSMTYGPTSPEEFMQFLQAPSYDSYVRVVKVKKPNYSLHYLNTCYRNE